MAVDVVERSLPRRLLPLLVLVILLGALVVSRLRGSEEGVGSQKPLLTIDFPAIGEAGSVQTAVLEVENPAASDIGALFVSFSALAAPGGEDFPTPIVAGRATGEEPAIVDIEPNPLVREAGVRFGFGPLEAGKTKTIRFDLRLPETAGEAANSVAVYDGEVPERGTGGRLEITVDP